MIPEKEAILKMYKEHKEFCNDQHDETSHPHYDDVECFLRWVGEVIEQTPLIKPGGETPG